ncbi:piezo-type mechanosensitive ion channel component 1-like [Lampetra fluviatilis]
MPRVSSGFRLVPFLIELRAVMDWVWTDTTLSLSNWMCVEDIYANIFILKCWRESEKRYPQPKGQKKKKVVKYGMGGMIVVLLICIVWFPLLFMSLLKSVAGQANTPIDVTITITLGRYQPLFTMSAQHPELVVLQEHEYEALKAKLSSSGSALQFMSMYEHRDVTRAKIKGNSGSVWSVSPPSRADMITELRDGTTDIALRFAWTLQRNLSMGGKAEFAMEKHVVMLERHAEPRVRLADMLEHRHSNNHSVCISKVFPRYIRGMSGPTASPVEEMSTEGDPSDLFSNVMLHLKRSAESSGHAQEWWSIRETSGCDESEGEAVTSDDLTIVVFSDEVSPPSLSFLAGYGILGLYASVVLVIGKFVREFFSGISHSIMFEELPNVDRILKLCTDIFLVRETLELELEEDLFAKLIFLYRSPETVIKWTREKNND